MEIAELRREIDKIDDSLIKLLKKRKAIAKKIFKAKLKNGLPKIDFSREKKIVERLKREFKGMDKEMISDLYKVIFRYSKKITK